MTMEICRGKNGKIIYESMHGDISRDVLTNNRGISWKKYEKINGCRLKRIMEPDGDIMGNSWENHTDIHITHTHKYTYIYIYIHIYVNGDMSMMGTSHYFGETSICCDSPLPIGSSRMPYMVCHLPSTRNVSKC